VNKKWSYLVEDGLCEPVELMEFELDAVGGGDPFSIHISASGSNVSAVLTVTIVNAPTTVIVNDVNNSINVSGP
jgi:hypothetical protein